jgi:hypothetical protein
VLLHKEEAITMVTFRNDYTNVGPKVKKIKKGSYSYRGNSIITTPNGYHLDKETGKIVETKTGKVTTDKKPVPICWSCIQLFLFLR